MKRILFFILLIISFAADAQIKQQMGTYGIRSRRVQPDSAFRIPTVQVGIKDAYAGFDTAQIYYRKSDSSLLTYTGSQWILARGAAVAGSSYTAGDGLNLTGSEFKVLTKRSITIDNDSLMLVNDELAPGATKVYGTDTSGVKGWQDAMGYELTAPAVGDLLRLKNDSTVENFTPNYVYDVSKSGDSLIYYVNSVRYAVFVGGTTSDTTNSIQEFTGSFPATGNIGLNLDLNRIQYKALSGVDTVIYTVAIQDSTIHPEAMGMDSIAMARVYSVRKIKSAYTGYAIKLRRSSDNAEVDVSFDSGDEISGTSTVSTGGNLTTWKGSDSLFVVTWYDQSGNAQNATSVTQPYFVLNTIDGKSAVYLQTTSNEFISYPAVWSGASERSVHVLYQNLKTGTFVNPIVGQWGSASNGTWFLIQSRTQFATGHPYLAGYAADLTNSASPDATTPLQVSASYNGTTGYLRKNNAQIATGALTLNTTTSSASIGKDGDGFFAKAYVCEVIIRSVYNASTISIIDANQKAYFGL